MIYSHKFHLQCAHFNSQQTYDIYWRIVDARLANDENMVPPAKELLEAFNQQHGHNFQIEVILHGDMNDDGWMLDDIALEKLVMQWNNVNLSCLPEFVEKRQRATTERMAAVLADKIKAIAPNAAWVRVRVYETPDIYAETINTV